MSSTIKSTRGSKSDAVSYQSATNEISKSVQREPEIIWPEWSDAEINTEKWGTALKFDSGIKDKGKPATPRKEVKGKITSKTETSPGKAQENEQFEDPYAVELPWSLHKGHPVYWQRPHTIFPDKKLLIHLDNGQICPDLVTSNRRILRSEFIRSFVSSVQILTYIGHQYPFEIEWQTIHFLATTRNLPWEPWHHIYSIGRAGGTVQHNPVCNSLGKYAVRLFWLGCWRKILVDDRVPVSVAGRLLLPTTSVENTNEIELWPLLLTKALMKVSSLSWTDQKELVDFDIISCLTGWAVQKLNMKGLDIMDKWEICCSYSDHFTWDKKILKEDNIPKVLENDTITKQSKKKSLQESKKRKLSKSGKADDQGEDNTNDFHLVGTLADLRNYADILDDITPCWSHECLIESSRNIPLVKQVSDVTDDFASWKEFRWINWAIEHGLWEADFTLENKKFVKIVSSLRKVVDNNTVDLETSYKEKCIKCSVEEFLKFFELRETGKLGKEGGKLGKDSPRQGKDGAKQGKKPASAATQNKDKSAKNPKTSKVERFVDPSIWCYFNKIGEYINSLSIYVKPSSFSSRYALTNFKIGGPPIARKVSKKDDKKGKDAEKESDTFKHILWENILQKSRNDTMYLFTDSIDFRLTVFTLAHIGKDFPEGKQINLSNEALPINCDKPFCLSGNCSDDCSCQKKDSVESVSTNFIDKRRTASLIVEDYNWTRRQTGDMSMFLKTYGTSSLFFNFVKGRHIKRIWMNAEPAFCLHVFSDDPHIKIGKCDEILERMAVESELLTKQSFELCTAFGDLAKNFATPEYPLALRSFYKSYLPNDIQLSKKNSARIHNCFLNEFKVILAQSYPDMLHYEISRAIRIILLDPNFRIPYTVDIEPYVAAEPTVKNVDACPCNNTIEKTDKEKEMAAIKIQSFFKMYHVKRMKDIHNINNNHFPRIIESIKSIYMDIFSSKNRDLLCIKLLRGMIFNQDINDLIKYYVFYNDLKSVIDLKLFSGDISEMKQIKFLPLIKRSFCCNDDEVYMRPYMFSTLPTYIVRVFDNDTAEEIDRYTNNALVHKYIKNTNGYTIFAFGFSNLGAQLKTHSWKLLIASEKIFVASSIEVDPQPNSISQLEGVYMPNLDNLVSKIRVKVNQNSRGTFHLQTSSPTVRLKMECTTVDGSIVAEAYGMSSVMIPFVKFITEFEEPLVPELSTIDKNLKQTKKNKSQRRVSSKSMTMKEGKKLVKDSALSIQNVPIKKKLTSVSEQSQFDCQEYFIRVIVLENSWPLTISEWNLVNTVRAQSNVESELFTSKSAPTRSSLNTQKKPNTRNTPRRLSKLKDVSISKPFWIFSSYCDGQKLMNISIDFTRMDEIRELKKSIILEDTQRYLEGKEKRQEFLERSYLQWTPPKSPSIESVSDNFALTNLDAEDIEAKNLEISLAKEVPITQSTPSIKSVCRTCHKEIDPEKFEYLKAPESRHKMLPPFDYNKYNERINEYRWPVDEKRENEILDAVKAEIENFQEENQCSIESLDKYLKETKKNYKTLNNWYKDIREESNQMMIKNDAKREYYIQKLKEDKPAKETKGNDPKKSKKK